MRKRVILVADDSADDRLLVGEALAQAGVCCRVEMVADGQKALDYVRGAGEYQDRQRYPVPEVLLLDLKMPVKDGFQTLEEVKADDHWRLLPVVIFSASSLPADIEKAYRLGANAYLAKPSSLAELVTLMRTVVEFWLRFNFSALTAEDRT
jgi:CheY-like chemotaxis protein